MRQGVKMSPVIFGGCISASFVLSKATKSSKNIIDVVLQQQLSIAKSLSGKNIN